LSRLPIAREYFERSLALFRKTVGDRTFEVAEVLGALATFFAWNDDNIHAERLARESIAIFEVTAPPMHPDRVMAQITLGEVLRSENKFDEAAETFSAALRKQIQLFGANSGYVADTLDALALVRYSQQQLAEAKRLSHEAIAIAHIVYGDNHAATANMGVTLSRTLIALGEYSEAEATLRRSLEVLASSLPPDNQYTAAAEYYLGDVILATNTSAEAAAVLTGSMNRWQRAGAPPWRAMRSASALGEALYRLGRTQTAEKYLSESFRVLSADSSADPATRDKARQRFVRYVKKSP